MKAIKLAAAVAVYAILSSTAHAESDQPFSALEAVKAEALSTTEMNEVYGQLTPAQIKATMMVKVADPRLEALLVRQVGKAPSQALKVLALVVRGRF
jgi:hypothetical protein